MDFAFGKKDCEQIQKEIKIKTMQLLLVKFSSTLIATKLTSLFFRFALLATALSF